MAGHVQSFLKGAQKLKLRELVSYTTQYSKEHLTYSKVKPQLKESLDRYTDKYIDAGSIKPLSQLMWGVFFLSYAIAWPGEYRHMKAEEEKKLKGDQGHH